MSYTIGDDVKVRITFRVSGAPTDPGTWQLVYRPPGVESSPVTLVYPTAGLSQLETGVYQWLLSTDRDNPDHAGRWDYWVTSTPPAKASEAGHFVVDRAPFDI
jgi:hypothetical protein